jgi:hypothetical protein
MRRALALTRRSFVAAIAGAAFVPPMSAAEGLPKVVVMRDPNCGCCSGWVEHLKDAGFPVEVLESSDLTSIKARLGVPQKLAACHTAEVAGYVVEGHVPATAISGSYPSGRRPLGWRYLACR